MSEYQYYEFRTVNRQLTASERAAVAKLSSHGETTATSFSVNYSYGSFKHEPEEVLTRYFDLFFYIANWGSVQLIFRYPKELIDTRALEPYCLEGQRIIDYKVVDDHVILRFELNHEDGGFGWTEGEGMVDGVVGLYEEIMQRDYRALYLAWLGAIQDGTEYSDEFDDETLEPPLPPGLHALSPALQEFVNLFELDEHLIAAAAQGSTPPPPTKQIDQATALATLSKAESIDFLQRLLQGEAHLELKLKQRLGLLPINVGYAPTGQRTVGELLATRHELEQIRQKAAAAAKEVQRRARLAALVAQGDSAWQDVETLIEKQTSEGYKQAVALLLQLGELAREQQQDRIFASRVEAIRARYRRRSGLMRLLEQAQL